MRAIADWAPEGNCSTTTTPDKFYPERGYSPLPGLAICQGCPVMRDCLEYALVHNEAGTWGGTTSKQRRLRYPLEIVSILRERYAEARLLEIRSVQPILYILRAGDKPITMDKYPALSEVMEA